jgi:hypothetical protein
MRLEGKRVRIEYHEQSRGQYRNVYLDKVPRTSSAATTRTIRPSEFGAVARGAVARWRGAGREPRSDDLSRVQVPARVEAVEQRVEHRHPRGRDVLEQPLGVLGPDRVMM